MKDTRVTLKGEGAAANPNVIAKTGGSASIEKLGASFAPASAQLKSRYGAKSGVVVTGVEQGKIFDSLDISKGLLVTAVNGRPVNSAKDIEAALPQSRNGMTTITGVTAEGKFTYSF